MVELPELNEDQRLFLQTIFDYFHQEGKWPTYLWVESTILQTHPERRPYFDMEEVCKSLPDNFAAAFGFNRNYEQEAALSVPALTYFHEAKEELADFIRVVGFCVERIITSNMVRPQITSEDLSNQLDMQPLAISKMGLLLQSEFDIIDGSGFDKEWWRCTLKRGKNGVIRFEGVETVEQYLEKRTALTRYFSGNVAVQPAQSEPTNDVRTMGIGTALGSTPYHIVQGDQYNISGTSGDQKVTSLSTDAVSPRRLRAFLCHSSGDKLSVRRLYQRLKANNVTPWLDEEDLLPGQNWEQEIRKAVRDADIVIVCLSCDSINKTGFVQKEIKFALDVADEQPEGTIFLIPLKLEECELPERLRHLQAVNYFEEGGIDKLLRALKHRIESSSVKLAPIEQYRPKLGDEVWHAKFGKGIILNSEMVQGTQFVEVQFQGIHGKKRLSMDYARLEKL